MMLKDEFNVLRSIPLFAGMEPSKLKLLAFASDRLNYAEGETLFRQGDVADSAFVILSGEAEAFLDTASGTVSLGIIGPQQVVGEVAILTELAASRDGGRQDPGRDAPDHQGSFPQAARLLPRHDGRDHPRAG